MQTQDLIDQLASQGRPLGPAAPRLLPLALAGGLALATVAFLATMGARPDLAAALETWRFPLKLLLVGLALVVALLDCRDAAYPVPTPWPLGRAALLPILVLAAILVELALVPMTEWSARLVGTNWRVCLTAIPALALPVLVLVLVAMRRGAPASPGAAGAAAGRLAAAAAALLYATHCIDDSPLFVATWYLLASLPVVAVARLAGGRLLRW